MKDDVLMLDDEYFYLNENDLKEKKRKGRKPKTLFQVFSNYPYEVVMEAFNDLPAVDQTILKRAFGESLTDVDRYHLLSENEKIVIRRIKKQMRGKIVGLVNKRTSRKFTGDYFSKTLSRENYGRLHRNEEINRIKKAKLSYYNEVSFEDKELYLKYYMDVCPKFRLKYINSLPYEREELISKEIAVSKKYRDEFLESNMWQVENIASKYRYIVPMDDLVIEGFFGLVKALKNFDLSRKTKFSTYAFFHIKKSILLCVNKNSKLIRLPVGSEEQLTLVKNTIEEYRCVNYRVPTVNELSLLTGLSVTTLKRILSFDEHMSSIISLNKSVSEEDDASIESIVSSIDDGFDKIDDKLYYDYLLKLLDNSGLDPVTIKIIKLHYGIGFEETKSFSEISKMLGISYSLVHRREIAGLKQLRDALDVKEISHGDLKSSVNIDYSFEQFKEVLCGLQFSEKELLIIFMYYVEKKSLKEISLYTFLPIKKLDKFIIDITNDSLYKYMKSKIDDFLKYNAESDNSIRKKTKCF